MTFDPRTPPSSLVNRTASRSLKRRGPSPMALEPRLMFDGAAAYTAVDAMHLDAVKDIAVQAIGAAFAAPERAMATRADVPSVEIAFVDTRLENWQSLVAGIRPGIEVVLVQAADNGVDRMASVLQGKTDITAIHVFGHGRAGVAELGSSSLSGDDLTDLQNQLSVIGASLTPDGDILLYGCSIAQGTTGVDFTTRLSELTGAGVAASVDTTGNAARAGDWDLEATTESIGAASALTLSAQTDYTGILGIPTINQIVRLTPGGESTNADSVTFRVTFSEAVTNVSGTDFTFAQGSISGATVQLVTEVTNSNRTQYDVVVGGLAGKTGTVNLDISTAPGLTSVNGNQVLGYANPPGGHATGDQSYTIDRVTAAPVINGLLTSNDGQGDSGSSTTDFVTTNQNLKIVGSAEAGSTVQVFRNGVSIGSSTANGAGVWTLDGSATTLAAGNYTLSAQALDLAGNAATSATVALVIDTSAPALTSAVASDISLTLTYAEALDANNPPTIAMFSVKVDGVTATVNRVTVDAVAGTITLTLAAPVIAGQTVLIAYTDPTGADDATALQDKAGNDAGSLVNQAVTNDTHVANAAPSISRVSGATWFSKGDAATLVFTEAPALTDTDDGFLESATITITSNRDGTDGLSIVGALPSGITAGAYDATTGKLTLTGHASLASYQTALALVRFANTTGAGIGQDRTITLTVNDGQVDSAIATRTMRVFGSAFSTAATDTAYLTQSPTGDTTNVGIKAINLVTGVSTSLNNGQPLVPGKTLNATAFNPIDGHLYAYNQTDRVFVRINADFSITTLDLALNFNFNSGDMDDDGQYYASVADGTAFYQVDLNPSSVTYLQVKEITLNPPMSGGTINDFAVSPINGHLYGVVTGSDANKDTLFHIDPKSGALSFETRNITGTPGAYGAAYFGDDGRLYVGNNGTGKIYRITIDYGNYANSTSVLFAQGQGNVNQNDGARIVTIELDYGDAPTTYNNGQDDPRHSIVSASSPFLGIKPSSENAAKGFTGVGDDKDDGIATFGPLATSATTYSTTISVTNPGTATATLVGWIDFDKDGQFDGNEAATATVAGNTTGGTATLTWTGLTGLTAGSTYARFRISTDANLTATGHTGTNRDSQSFGVLANGEVEDYAVTIQAPDVIVPRATIEAINPILRHTAVSQVNITFDEPVRNVDISDFTLTRDSVAVALTGLTVSGSGISYTIDLSSVTNSAGQYVLTLTPSNITDLSGNALSNSPTATFTIDTTAPFIDLAPNDRGTLHYTTSTNGVGLSLDNNDHEVTLTEASDAVTQIAIRVGGLQDGDNERLAFGSTTIRADGADGALSNITVGGQAIDVAYANGVFTITKNGGGTLTAQQAQSIVRELQYSNTKSMVTVGHRTFSFTATDAAGITSTPSVATINVIDTTAPSRPTIDLLDTSDTGSNRLDNKTKDITPTLRVRFGDAIAFGTQSVADDVVKLFDGNTEVGRATLVADDITAGYVDITSSTRTPGDLSFTATVTDASNNVSIASAALPVVLDTTAPLLATAQVHGNTLTLTYTETGVGVDTLSPAPGHFSVSKGVDNSPVTVINVTINPSTKTVTLTLGSAIASTDTHVLVSYTPGLTQDIAGNFAAPLEAQAVANRTPGITSISLDSGTAGDFATNDTTLVFTGTAPANALVEVKLNGVVLGTPIADAQGVWTYDHTTTTLADATYTLTASITEGGVTATATQAVVVDTTAPAAPSVDLLDASDTGSNHLDNQTNDTTPTLRVWLNQAAPWAVAGDVVTLFDGSTEVGRATLLQTHINVGFVDITSSTRTPGLLKFTATVTDAANNTSIASAALPVVLDTTAPLLATAQVHGNTLTLTYTETGVGIDSFLSPAPGNFSVSKGVGNTPVSVTGVVIDPTAKTVTLTLGAAIASTDTHVLVSYTPGLTQDIAGNLAAPLEAQAVANRTPGITSISLDSGTTGDFITNDNTLVFTGTAPANAQVIVQLDGVTLGTSTADAQGVWTYDHTGVALADATYALTASVIEGGIVATATQAVVVDTTAPGVAPTQALGPIDISTPTDTGANDTTTANGTPVITFTGEAGLVIGLLGADGTPLVQDTHYRVDYDAGTGAYTVTLLDAIAGGAANPFGTYANGVATNNTASVADGTYIITATDLAHNTSTVGRFVIDTAVIVVVPPEAPTPVPPIPDVVPVLPPVVVPVVEEPAPPRVAEIETTTDTGANRRVADALLTSNVDGATRVLVIRAEEPALFRFNGVPDQNFDITDRVRFQLPPDAFVHTQENAVVRIVATRADGGPLPSWLVFNPTTGTFEGQPPANSPDELSIMVVARDAEGREASTIFRIKINSAEQTRPLSRLGITEQIRLKGQLQALPRSLVSIGAHVSVPTHRTM